MGFGDEGVEVVVVVEVWVDLVEVCCCVVVIVVVGVVVFD